MEYSKVVLFYFESFEPLTSVTDLEKFTAFWKSLSHCKDLDSLENTEVAVLKVLVELVSPSPS